MRLTLLAVGDKMPDWAESATTEYLKRLPREARMALVTVKPEKRTGQSADSIKALEASRLLEKIPAGSRLVALDEHGRQVTTKELAEQLARWLESGKDTVLVIGGADGLAPAVLERAD
jgi:23S rRNA (pseudouridine1915-N3)-methyltransferase